MTALKFGIVGATAIIANSHIRGITENNARITAFMDLPAKAEKMEAVAAEHEALTFTDFGELLACDEVDAVALCTPHPLHCEQVIAALAAGKHVMTEKPMAVRAAECDRMLAAEKKAATTLGVIFQRRFAPPVVKALEMIQSGDLGRILHIDMVLTAYKSDFYFKSASWRGTWRGEGGGVLLNQAPHALDLFQHLFGMPARIHGRVRNLIHQGVIEVEDSATVLAEFADGCAAAIHFDTATLPPRQHVEIFADKGNLRIEGSRLTYTAHKAPAAQYAREYSGPDIYNSPAVDTIELELSEHRETHTDCYREFIRKINGEANQYVSASSAARSVELANAVILSSYRDKTVNLPLDREEYEKLFAELAGV